MALSDQLYPCAHCAGKGTCTNGAGNTSCAVCAKKGELGGHLGKGPHFSLACSTCGGLGQTDTFTYRLTHRTQPVLSIALVTSTIGLVAVFRALGNPNFPQEPHARLLRCSRRLHLHEQ